MRNSIELNGVSSTTITGLLIQELPPISKPKIRTSVEEIDGRDGDIVTKLGYSAYDKEVKIGLYGDFDIDEVIEYFTGEGQVVFSNEPDKYYNYQILEQVDYERLVRYRQATVTFHVQPFKYLVDEEQIQVDTTMITDEGTESMSLKYTEAGALLSMALKGNTSQGSDPTPSAPQAIHSVSGNNTITVCGKNLFDKDNANILNASFNSTNIPSSNNAKTLWIPCLPNTTYTISKVKSERFAICGTDVQPAVNGTPLNYEAHNTATKITYTTSATTNYLCVYYFLNNTDTLTEQEIRNSIQIEYGETATNYASYTGHDYSLNLGTIHLNKFGNYADYFYKENSTWYLHKETGELSLAVADMNNSENYAGWQNSGIVNIMGSGINQIMTTDIFINVGNRFSVNTTGSNDVVYLPKGTYGLTQSEWISTYPDLIVNLLVVLATPTNTEITDETLIEQLEAIANAISYDGQTNIIQSNNDLPLYLEVSAYGSVNTTITNEGNYIAKPLLTIYATGDFGVYLNGLQVFQIAMGNYTKIALDIANMEAYDPDTNVLLNRLVTGNYDNFILNKGNNELVFNGSVSGFTMDNYSRWL